MDTYEAIKLLSGASRGYLTINDEFKDACKMGIQALLQTAPREEVQSMFEDLLKEKRDE